jgi:AcrR family transcriptional regulator
MRSLAASVGISAGSLYYHIDSKQALLSDLISEYELNLLQVFRSKTVGMAKHPLQMSNFTYPRPFSNPFKS